MHMRMRAHATCMHNMHTQHAYTTCTCTFQMHVICLYLQHAHLLSGKVAKGEYILDYGYPLTPLQALALGLSALALKLANEGG